MPELGGELGIPVTENVFLKTCSNVTSANSNAMGSEGLGMSMTEQENLSSTSKMTVFPHDTGRSVMKSTTMCDQGRHGMVRGRSLPAGKHHGTFAWVHVEHKATNALMSHHILGQQYFS